MSESSRPASAKVTCRHKEKLLTVRNTEHVNIYVHCPFKQFSYGSKCSDSQARTFDYERLLMQRTAEATFAVAQMARTGIIVDQKPVINGRRLSGRRLRMSCALPLACRTKSPPYLSPFIERNLSDLALDKRQYKLKPLNPVDVNGPTIQFCRGIVAGTRPQVTSRTLKRHQEIVQMMAEDKSSQHHCRVSANM